MACVYRFAPVEYFQEIFKKDADVLEQKLFICENCSFVGDLLNISIYFDNALDYIHFAKKFFAKIPRSMWNKCMTSENRDFINKLRNEKISGKRRVERLLDDLWHNENQNKTGNI